MQSTFFIPFCNRTFLAKSIRAKFPYLTDCKFFISHAIPPLLTASSHLLLILISISPHKVKNIIQKNVFNGYVVSNISINGILRTSIIQNNVIEVLVNHINHTKKTMFLTLPSHSSICVSINFILHIFSTSFV